MSLGKRAKLKLIMTMLSITRLMDAMKRVTMRLRVEGERLQASNERVAVEVSMRTSGLMVKTLNRYFIRNPPRMLAMDLTKKIKEK